MSLQLTKTEKVFAVIVTAAISTFFGFFLLVNKSTSNKFDFSTDTGINYKMARPDQAFAEYTLEGRELDQYYEGLTPEEKKIFNKKKNVLEAVKQVEDKKKEEVKKKQVATAQKAQKQRKASQEQAKQYSKQVEIKTESKKRGQKQSENSYIAENTNYNANNFENPSPSVDENNQVKSNKKSFSEWRNIIFAEPTPENMAAFVAAFRKGEVTSTELQAMAQDLLDQEENNLKGLGLAILRSVPSLQSLSQLVHEESNLPPTYQTYVEQSLLTYFYPQNIGFIKSALQTSDPLLKAKVLSLLQINLTRLSNGDSTAFVDARNRRSGGTELTMSGFVTLIPALAAITANANDGDLASVAQQVLSLIQTHNNIAQN
jgi:hypothetical protein